MYTNKKTIASIVAVLCLFAPLSTFANEKNGIEETKQSIITFTSIQKNENKDEKDDGSKMNVNIEDTEEALNTDINLVVKETGFSEDSIRETIKFQESFGIYADKILKYYPNKVSSIYVNKIPAMQGHIRFIGEVPKELVMAIEKEGQENKIILTGGEKNSFNQNLKRAELVSKALHNIKIYNTAIFFDQIKNVIQIELKLSEKEEAPSLEKLINNIRKTLKNSSLSKEAIIIDESDLNLKIIRGDGEIMSFEYTRGGSSLYDDGTFECTLGWSVQETISPYRYGYITAKHCSGINQHQDHVNGDTYSSSWTKDASGQVDVEFHETPTSYEYDDFHASNTEIRDVFDIKATNDIAVGNRVCVYGRSSDDRSCDHYIEAVDVTVTFSSGTVNRHLARTDNHTTIGGDSGTGWSWNRTAWGVHTGGGGGKSYFTPAEVAESYTNVRILK